MIADNLRSVTQRLTRCCEKIGASCGDVVLVCVTKEASIDQVRELIGLGQHMIGENRVQDAVIKHRSIRDEAVWHMVGHLQTNKVRDAVKIFSLIHSVDSVRLAKEVDSHSKKSNKVQDMLIQVNTSGEASKFGVAPDEAVDLVREISELSNIRVKGLMTIAPEAEDPELARPCFRKLRELRNKINSIRSMPYTMQILSMGMTDDFEVAIEEGSNMVRIGRAIFKNDK